MLSMMPRALRAVGVPQFTASAPPPPAPPPCRALHPRALHLVAHASGGAPRAPRPHASPPPASTLVGEGGAWGVERRAAHRHAGVCHASSFLEEAEVEAPRAEAQDGDVRQAEVTASRGKGQRMDAFLTEQLAPVSRAKIQGMIKLGQVSVNGVVETRARQKMKSGDTVRCVIPPPEPMEAAPEDIPLDIVYEDDHLIVVNKQAQLVVHPAPGNRSGTLVNAILFHCGLPAVRLGAGETAVGGLLNHAGGGDGAEGEDGDDDDDEEEDWASTRSSVERSDDPVIRPGIVHRLDKGTSGLLVIAKDDITHRSLCEQFAERSVQRSYLSVTCGVPEPKQGRVVANIGRSMVNRKAMAVVGENTGRHAASKYLVREELAAGGCALVEWRLETGRTHQIRVHAKHLNTPLFGDDTYGGGAPQAAGKCARPAAGFTPQRIKSLCAKLNRPALHALTLGFVHPITRKPLSFQTDPPEDFVTLVEALRQPPDWSKDDIKAALGYSDE